MTREPTLKAAALNGATFHYVESGRGAPLVFVHGAVSDHRYWGAQLTAVSAVARCHALDQRYFGGWQWPEDGPPYGIMNHAVDLAAFVQHVVREPAHVVATSYGSAVALAMVATRPDLARSLCLHEPALTSFITSEAHRAVIANERAGLAPIAEAVSAGQVAAALRRFAEWTINAPGAFDRLPADAQRVLLDNAHSLKRHLSAQPATVTAEQLQAVSLPVTLLVGEVSRPYFRLVAEALHGCLPRSTLVELAAGNHLAPVEQPPLFNQQVIAHLARHAANT